MCDGVTGARQVVSAAAGGVAGRLDEAEGGAAEAERCPPATKCHEIRCGSSSCVASSSTKCYMSFDDIAVVQRKTRAYSHSLARQWPFKV